MNLLGQRDFSSQPKLLNPLGLDEANEKDVAENNGCSTSHPIQCEPARQGLGIDHRLSPGERFQRQDSEQSREEENLDHDNQRQVFEVSDEAKSPTNPNCARENNQDEKVLPRVLIRKIQEIVDEANRGRSERTRQEEDVVEKSEGRKSNKDSRQELE